MTRAALAPLHHLPLKVGSVCVSSNGGDPGDDPGSGYVESYNPFTGSRGKMREPSPGYP